MRIVVAGATGFIGAPLCRRLAASGHEVKALVRGGRTVIGPSVAPVEWDARKAGPWQDHVRSADAVINLAGASVAAKRWTPAYKEVLRASRVDTTRALVEALGEDAAGKTLLNGSAIGYYGDTGEQAVDETAPPGSDFLAGVCVAWEDAARTAEAPGARVVLLRLGVVLGEGGALEKMALPFRYFAGGPLGSGRQWFSWIHLADALGIIELALTNGAARGPINLTSPEPVRLREVARTLGRVLRRPSWVPAPAFALRLVLGEFASTLLASQRIIPAVAPALGYRWQYGALEPALRDILSPRSSAV